MSLWNRLFASEPDPPTGTSRQLPGTLVAAAFGEVNVRPVGNEVEVTFTVLMEPDDAEGWQTGVGLSAAQSMEPLYGRGGPTNEVEPLARRLIAYLASRLDADGGTTVVYWGCDGNAALEEIGTLTAPASEAMTFPGPRAGFGKRALLAPVLRHFADRFTTASNGMCVFLTDGRIDDLDTVKADTAVLCRAIEAGTRRPLKCVLIGVGDQVDARQMEELDDLDTGTGVDLWDHKIARDMRGLIDIFAEVVGENQIVAPEGRILDATGAEVKSYPAGLPARATFRMPADSPHFELVVGDWRIRQSVVEPVR